ncbi:MAG: hypothetical protein MJE66_25785 [Proteobacteria bacterium]|nr:hypothetical protein [Pseudomonadota bacterium]
MTERGGTDRERAIETLESMLREYRQREERRLQSHAGSMEPHPSVTGYEREIDALRYALAALKPARGGPNEDA